MQCYCEEVQHKEDFFCRHDDTDNTEFSYVVEGMILLDLVEVLVEKRKSCE